MPQQEFPKTVIILGNHDANLFTLFTPIKLRLHLETVTNFLDAILQGDLVRVHFSVIKVNALEKEIGGMIRVLFAVNDTTAVPIKELRKCGHDAIGVGSMYAQDARRWGGLALGGWW